MNSFLVKIFTGSLTISLVVANALPIKENSSKDVTFYDFVMCGLDNSPLTCAKNKVGRVIDYWEDEIHQQMKSWGGTLCPLRYVALECCLQEADKEVKTNGRQLGDQKETPSHAAHQLQLALNELATILQKSIYRTILKKQDNREDIEEVIVEATDEEIRKDKKKRKKTHPGNAFIKRGEEDDMSSPEVEHKNVEMIQVGENLSVDAELVGPSKLRVKRENETEEGRGKKKKQKKAILKLLLLGAVLKAKIGLLLQLLTAHLQVKFFAIALAGLALNIARFWLDLKKGHSPQKVIYYEHAQHQHHYEHDDDGWGGYWSRSMDTKKGDKKDTEFVESPSSSDDLAYGGWARSKSN